MQNEAQQAMSDFVNRYSAFKKDFAKTPNRVVEEKHEPLPQPKEEPVKPKISEQDYEIGPARTPEPAPTEAGDMGGQPGMQPNLQYATGGNSTNPDPAYSTPNQDGGFAASDPEKRKRRQEVTAKSLFYLYDYAQQAAAIWAYDKWVTPKELIGQRDHLMKKVYEGQQLSPDESLLLQRVNKTMEEFQASRSTYGGQLSMRLDEQFMQDMNELSVEIMEINEIDPNPLLPLGLMLLGKPAMNGTQIFIDRQRFNKVI